ncbi:solute carrier family 25 member 35-like [Drosophila tropicalis]|uniref:solute carrier family 25 member 35-like n=1 Tax=Drosophila tropicalis TaxID=46794 RepID=UPI0035ABC7F0
MSVSDFILGGVAAMGATVFTNPLDVIKTRVQLQGELARRGTYVEPYKGVAQAFYTVLKNDGLLALQQGLVPSLCFRFVINSIRLGVYSIAIDNHWMHTKDGDVSYGLGLFWGALGGVTGSFAGNPFFLIKTQLQSQTVDKIAVGRHRHSHSSMVDAIRTIFHNNGFFGLWRGSMASIYRATVASSVQIATFGKMKSVLNDNEWLTRPTSVSFCSSLFAGTFLAVASTPLDVIATRLFNQAVDSKGRGVTYSGALDCCIKILKSEGIYGLYKGFWANYLRVAPHTTLTLVFFDELVHLKNQFML